MPRVGLIVAKPTISDANLVQDRELRMNLSRWAPTVHRLVKERIAALVEASTWSHPLETHVEYAQRVLAHGQYPLPEWACVYDDLTSNRGYDYISTGYPLEGDGAARIEFVGLYPDLDDLGRLRKAEIHCPAWLVTDPDGESRFRQQTAEMVAAAVAAEAETRTRIDSAMEAMRREAQET